MATYTKEEDVATTQEDDTEARDALREVFGNTARWSADFNGFTAQATINIDGKEAYNGPVPATGKLLKRLGLTLDNFDILEINEAFAVQALACTRELGLADDDPRINTRGGAIALGHPLGMSGARLALTAFDQLQRGEGKRALCTMCIGVGQGIAMLLERVN